MNLKHLSLAKRQDYENITVVPILSDTDTPFDVLDLKKGLKMGLVTIGECDSTNVEKVKLKNNSVSPLILLDGEEIAGSLQNRIVAQTMIIPPKSEMEIPVNCSEKGRNEYKSEFQYSDYIANSNTRRKKKHTIRTIPFRKLSGIPLMIWKLIKTPPPKQKHLETAMKKQI